MSDHGRFKRFPHLTPEDVEILDVLSAAEAREFENYLQREHRHATRARQFETLECDLGDQAVEKISARETARWGGGPGGGRQRPRRPAAT